MNRQREATPVTQTQTQTETQTESPRLILRPQRRRNSQRVHWTDDTCDNENLNRKSSKVCCIYHPPTEFGESSDEDIDDSETDSEAEENAGQKCCHHRGGRPNAYERQPKRKD